MKFLRKGSKERKAEEIGRGEKNLKKKELTRISMCVASCTS